MAGRKIRTKLSGGNFWAGMVIGLESVLFFGSGLEKYKA